MVKKKLYWNQPEKTTSWQHYTSQQCPNKCKGWPQHRVFDINTNARIKQPIPLPLYNKANFIILLASLTNGKYATQSNCVQEMWDKFENTYNTLVNKHIYIPKMKNGNKDLPYICTSMQISSRKWKSEIFQLLTNGKIPKNYQIN